MSNVVFIIGNGFNFMVQSVIDNIPIRDLEPKQVLTRKNVADNIRNITLLWKKFQLVFEELRNHFSSKGNNISDEDLIKLINSVINFFSNLEGFEKVLTVEDIEKLKSVFDKFLLNKISEIAEEFRIHQENKSYRLIRQYFPNFSKEIIEAANTNELKRVAFFTTNYDGILDTLLTTIPKGFTFKDGFGHIVTANDPSKDLDRSGSMLGLSAETLAKKQFTICHIHGSYRFMKYFGRTYKTIGNVQNREPVMVFNQPDSKDHIVRNDNVLNEYMRYLTLLLKSPNTTRLVILGNSMEAEPHIKSVIKENYNRTETEIIVSSRDPQKIIKELQGYYDYPILPLPVGGINTEEEMISLFKDYLTISKLPESE